MPIIGTPGPAILSARWTYLYLVQRLAQEIGSTTAPSDTILTLAESTGEIRRLADWIANAWLDIQGLHRDWQFQRRTVSFATVNGQGIYTPTEVGIVEESFGSWDMHSFRSYLTSAGIGGEIAMTPVEYDIWRDSYLIGSLRSSYSHPTVVANAPNGGLALGIIPLVGYTITGDYYLAPVELRDDDDLTTLPHWHNKMIIVYKAMEDHGFFDGAQEVLGRSDRKFPGLLSRLRRDQLRRPYGPGALA